MALPIVPVLVGALGAMVTKAFELFFTVFAFKLARNLAVATAAIALAGGLTVGMILGLKVAVIAARFAMPNSLGAATFFLPSNLYIIIPLIVTVRLSHFLWQWSMKNLTKYTMQIHV